ncbi:hypothetical protein NC651_003207 [Populus alba x Populus x berolinensis]|nr:hypothetical protein NC651_003207 [Populus alba x Populus x berolinensis]
MKITICINTYVIVTMQIKKSLSPDPERSWRDEDFNEATKHSNFQDCRFAGKVKGSMIAETLGTPFERLSTSKLAHELYLG